MLKAKSRELQMKSSVVKEFEGGKGKIEDGEGEIEGVEGQIEGGEGIQGW